MFFIHKKMDFLQSFFNRKKLSCNFKKVTTFLFGCPKKDFVSTINKRTLSAFKFNYVESAFKLTKLTKPTIFIAELSLSATKKTLFLK